MGSATNEVAYRKVSISKNNDYDGGTIGFWRVDNLVTVGFGRATNRTVDY